MLYIEALVDRLSNLMKKSNHKAIGLLKLEIEGDEYAVIETIAEDKPDIKIICVEFDEIFHSKGLACLRKIKKSTDKIIEAGYTMVHSTKSYKRTFVRNDTFRIIVSVLIN